MKVMKRNILLLFVAVLSMGTAFADGVLSLDQLDATRSYYVRQDAKGYLYSNGGKAFADGKTRPTADDAHRWAVAYNEKLGAYFLYNLKDSTFLTTASGVCPLIETATPIYLFAAPQAGAWYACTSEGVVGLSQHTSGGNILLQGENATQPDALSFETSGTLSEDHLLKIETSVWLAVTKQTQVPVITKFGTRISSLDEITDGSSYLLYSTGKSKYAYDDGSALAFNASQPAANNLTSMPYVFTFRKVGGAYTIATGIEDNYISGVYGGKVPTGTSPATFTITASATAGSFNLYNSASSQYLNAQDAKPVGWGESEGNSRYQLIPVTLANSDRYFPVTYLCYETDGEHMRLMDVQTYAKSTNRLTAPAFTGFKRLSIKSADGKSSVSSAVTAPTVVRVTYERSMRTLPIVPTSVRANRFADTTTWYRLRVDERYLQYQADADGHYFLHKTDAPTMDDTDLWCFVGNNVEGYKLYNRAYGVANSLTFKNEPQATALPFIMEGEYPFWVFSNGPTTGSWYLSPQGKDGALYLADDSQHKLSVMGSSAAIMIYDAAAEMQDFAEAAAANLGTDLGQYPVADAEELVSAAAAYTKTAAAFNRLQQAYNDFRMNADRITVDRNRLYRIVNSDGGTLSAAIDAGTLSANEMNEDSRDQLWRLLPVGKTGGYYMLNPENGKFIGVTTGTREVTMLAAPTTHYYNLNNPAGALSIWTLKDAGTSTNAYVNLSTDGTQVTGGKATGATAAWRVVPVERFVIETKGTVPATTLCLPFSVSLPANITAAAITAKEEASVTMEPLTGGIIPANTPVLIISDAPGTFTLVATDETAAAPAANLLNGVDKRTTATGEQTFVLGNDSQFVPGDGTLAAYTAYLDRETTEAAALALVLPTAINNLNLDGTPAANGKWYDLQGRPVAAPVSPGIYVINGRKIIVK